MHLGSLEFCQPAMTACIYTKWRWVKEKILKTTWCDHVVTYLLTRWIRLPSTLKRNSPTNVKEIHGYRDCDMGLPPRVSNPVQRFSKPTSSKIRPLGGISQTWMAWAVGHNHQPLVTPSHPTSCPAPLADITFAEHLLSSLGRGVACWHSTRDKGMAV